MEASAPFRWSNRGLCTFRWSASFLGIKWEHGVDVVCRSGEETLRFRIHYKKCAIRIYPEESDIPLIVGVESKEPRSKLFGIVPLPRQRRWICALPADGGVLTIVDTWPNCSFSLNGSDLRLNHESLRHGHRYTTALFECLVRRWSSFGNMDTEFSWPEGEPPWVAMIIANHLRHELCER
jgi:hypothetical protein